MGGIRRDRVVVFPVTATRKLFRSWTNKSARIYFMNILSLFSATYGEMHRP